MTFVAPRTYGPSEAAERSGFSVETLRYYERAGLLARVGRTPGGRRAYTEEDLAWLSLVRCLRDTGMPIAQLRRYGELAADESTIGERLALLEAHERAVQESIEALRSQQDRLREKISWYREHLA